MLIDMLKAMQKAENVNCTLKLPLKTRWIPLATSLESVKKNKSVLRKIAVSEVSEVRRTLLDDTFWHESEAIVSLLKPLQSAITHLEEDSPKLADVCRIFFNFKYEILKSIDSFPFTRSEQEEIKSNIEKRKDFCIKIIHKAAYFFDPQEQGRLLNNNDRVSAMKFVCELAEKLSSCKILDVSAFNLKFLKSARTIQLKKDFSKRCFYGRMFRLFSQLPGGIGYCDRKELNKIAYKILNYQQQPQL